MPSSTRRLIIFGVIFLAITFLLALFLKPQEITPAPQAVEQVNFTELGYLTGSQSAPPTEGLTFTYDEPGAPAKTISLIFNEISLCTFGEESIPCLALSSPITGAVQERRVLIEGIKQDETVTVRNLVLDAQENRRFGFVVTATDNNQNVLLEIDEAEFLSGDEAIETGIEDTECTRETITECIPSLNNGFYIRNIEDSTETYILTTESEIFIFAQPGSPELEKVSLETFLTEYHKESSLMENYPFMFIADGATIITLEEQYLP